MLSDTRVTAGTYRRQAKRYVATVRWAIAFVVTSFGRRLVWSLVSASGGVIVVGVGIAYAVAIVTSLETGRPMAVRGVTLGGPAAEALIHHALAVAVLILVGSAMVFIGRRESVSIAADCQPRLARAVLTTPVGVQADAAAYVNDATARAGVHRLATSDPRMFSLAARRGIEAPSALMIALVGSLVLVALEPVAAAIAMSIFALSAPALYIVNLGAMRASRRFEEAAPAASAAVKQALQGPSAPAQSDAGPVRDAALRSLGDAAEAFRLRFHAIVRTDLVSQVVTGAALFVILLYLGQRAINGTLPLTTVATFVVVLRFVLGSIRSVSMSAVTLSRYYPALFRLASYLDCDRPHSTIDLPPALVFRRHADGTSEGDKTRVKVRLPAVIGLSSPVRPTQVNAGYFVSVTARALSQRPCLLASATYVINDEPLPEGPTSLRLGLHLPRSCALETSSLTAADAGHIAALGIVDLDTELPASAWRGLGSGLRRRLVFSSIAALDPLVIVVERRVFRSLRSLPSLARFGGALLVCDEGPPRSDALALHLVTTPDGGVVAFGRPSWVRSEWQRIEERLALHVASLQRAVASMTDDDDAT